jgi:hypothetical protein
VETDCSAPRCDTASSPSVLGKLSIFVILLTVARNRGREIVIIARLDERRFESLSSRS